MITVSWNPDTEKWELGCLNCAWHDLATDATLVAVVGAHVGCEGAR